MILVSLAHGVVMPLCVVCQCVAVTRCGDSGAGVWRSVFREDKEKRPGWGVHFSRVKGVCKGER